MTQAFHGVGTQTMETWANARCDELDASHTIYPGTDLRLVWSDCHASGLTTAQLVINSLKTATHYVFQRSGCLGLGNASAGSCKQVTRGKTQHQKDVGCNPSLFHLSGKGRI